MSESRENVHNFAAGPSPLPTPVLQKAAEGLINYNGTGMGVCELSHRGKDFKTIIEGAEGKPRYPADGQKLIHSQPSKTTRDSR
jgi:phosphoserine aminotransferase